MQRYSRAEHQIVSGHEPDDPVGVAALGTFILERRRAKRLNKAQFAQKIGVAYTTANNWERHDAIPDASNLGKIAQALELSDADKVRLFDLARAATSLAAVPSQAAPPVSPPGRTAAESRLRNVEAAIAYHPGKWSAATVAAARAKAKDSDLARSPQEWAEYLDRVESALGDIDEDQSHERIIPRREPKDPPASKIELQDVEPPRGAQNRIRKPIPLPPPADARREADQGHSDRPSKPPNKASR